MFFLAARLTASAKSLLCFVSLLCAPLRIVCTLRATVTTSSNSRAVTVTKSLVTVAFCPFQSAALALLSRSAALTSPLPPSATLTSLPTIACQSATASWSFPSRRSLRSWKVTMMCAPVVRRARYV